MIMILFNKDGRGSEELENITGQWYASSPYRLIRTEIDFAIREVRGRVGDAVMEAASDAYQSGSDEALLNAVRLPVDNALCGIVFSLPRVHGTEG